MTTMTATKPLASHRADADTAPSPAPRGLALWSRHAARAEVITYPALRIVAGAMFAFHGAQKVLGVYSQFSPPVGSQLWIGGVLELLGGTLIALGLLVRPAAFLLAGQMAVAYIQFHWKGALAEGMWIPTVNKGELAVLYAFLFLFIAAHGAGRASLSGLLGRRRSRQ